MPLTLLCYLQCCSVAPSLFSVICIVAMQLLQCCSCSAAPAGAAILHLQCFNVSPAGAAPAVPGAERLPGLQQGPARSQAAGAGGTQ